MNGNRFVEAIAACCALTLLALGSSAQAADKPGTTADDLETLPGFKVEVVLSADPKLNGSWISLGKDGQGRLLLGAQKGQPLTRVTIEDGKVVKQERLKLPVSEIMGQLYVFDSLYVDANDGKRFGLFRLRDTNGDGNYDKVELLREWDGGSGEHGAHTIVLGPDQKLYIVCGNFVKLPRDLDPNSPVRNYADDQVLPRAEDGNGFGAGNKPPGGHVIRVDPDGKHAVMVAAGERNTYAIAFNADGELFGFDSDMEWDWGTPWYRPIRFFHAPFGADQGFREGTAKFPEYYPDSLPAIVPVGIGSPTGVIFGAGARFPAKYQRALYGEDWTYGRIIACHLTPQGASYTGEWENLVAPKGLKGNGRKANLNLTGIVIGNDGALYFTTGGRSLEAQLYRVTYIGKESTGPADLHDHAGSEARVQRHKIEQYITRQDRGAIEQIWPHLGSPDRFIRFAARLAVENQPFDQWKSRSLSEKRPEAALTALLALARVGSSGSQGELLDALARLPLSSLPFSQQLDKLRVIEVSVSRQGRPAPQEASKLISELDPLYPAQSQELNRELCQTLLALGAHDAVAKTMALLAAAPTLEEQVGYVQYLRTIRTGWTPELRRQYFAWFTKDHANAKHPDYVLEWFEEGGRPYGDGASFPNFLAHFHSDAKATLTPEERRALAPVLDAYVPPDRRNHEARSMKFVKEWTMADLEPALDDVGHGHDYARAKSTFEGMQCLSCHKFGNEGGAVGPDLTAISSRYSRRDILAKILEPSRSISEQYAFTAVKLRDGQSIVGRAIEDTPDTLVLRPNPLAPEQIVVKKSDITYRGFSKTSPMPEGLLNSLHKEEVLDLLAYLESGGRKDHPDFARAQ